MEIFERLISEACAVRERAYVPYSHFPVGAALWTASGKIITGCNIENASYGLTNCAERTALYTALAGAKEEGDQQFKALAIVADSPRPLSPCGACRQVLAEFCPSSMPVYLSNLQGNSLQVTLGELLPYAFSEADLK